MFSVCDHEKKRRLNQGGTLTASDDHPIPKPVAEVILALEIMLATQ